jgi:hypothetical protein
MKNVWRDSVVLDNLHIRLEKMMNGYTAEEAAQGAPRAMSHANTRGLESWLAKANNRADVQRLIGDEGIKNLKNITTLLGNAHDSRAAFNVAKEVGQELTKRVGRAGWGAGAAGVAARAFGTATYWPALLGAGAVDAGRGVLRYAATNPNVGKMVDYAARNNIRPSIYAPLIARMIAVPMQEQKKPEAQDEEQGGQE